MNDIVGIYRWVTGPDGCDVREVSEPYGTPWRAAPEAQGFATRQFLPFPFVVDWAWYTRLQCNCGSRIDHLKDCPKAALPAEKGADGDRDPIIVNGQMAIDQDLDAIFEAWCAIQEGRPSASEYYFKHTRRGLTEALNLNPVGYLPRYEASRKTVLQMGARDGWTTQTLGALSEDQVFMGSRIARPSADKGVTSGSGIVRYFTGNAVTQTRGENVKYLDLNKAKPGQLRALEQMRLRRGMILITRSGTVGRVVYATSYLDGAIGTDDLIRVVIKDDALRGYVYQFLLSELGQNQLKANVYGAIVDHVEPKDVKQIIVPVPDDGALVKAIGLRVLKGIELQEQAAEQMADSQTLLIESLEADKRDGATARKRLAEAKRDPSKLVRGKALEDELARRRGRGQGEGGRGVRLVRAVWLAVEPVNAKDWRVVSMAIDSGDVDRSLCGKRIKVLTYLRPHLGQIVRLDATKSEAIA